MVSFKSEFKVSLNSLEVVLIFYRVNFTHLSSSLIEVCLVLLVFLLVSRCSVAGESVE